MGDELGEATKRFEASTFYKLLAIVAAIVSIDSFVWTLKRGAPQAGALAQAGPRTPC